MAHLGDANAHKDQDVRAALAPLSTLAEEQGMAVAVVRRGFRQLFGDQPHLNPCAEAAAPAEALDAAREHRPDLALIDLTLDGGDSGLELIKQLRAAHPDLPLLTVSMHDEVLYAERALAAGAQGYVMKRVPDETLLDAVRHVLGGGVYVSDAMRERLLEHSQKEGPQGNEAPLEQLSNRELEVFRFIGQGFAPRHVAERLHLSVKTVETHRRHLKQKLGLESSAELRRYAVAWRVERGGEP
jgi:DNA-binding NarL/FixJ family response regulator